MWSNCCFHICELGVNEQDTKEAQRDFENNLFLKEFASLYGNNYEFHFALSFSLYLCSHLLFITYLSIYHYSPNDMFLHSRKISLRSGPPKSLKPSIHFIHLSVYPPIHTSLKLMPQYDRCFYAMLIEMPRNSARK